MTKDLGRITAEFLCDASRMSTVLVLRGPIRVGDILGAGEEELCVVARDGEKTRVARAWMTSAAHPHPAGSKAVVLGRQWFDR